MTREFIATTAKSRAYIVTSGWAYVTKGGTSPELSDAKIFETERDAKNFLFESNLDLKYWTVREIKIDTVITVL